MRTISVITPCFNGEKFLFRYLDSLVEQDYKDVEFIFVNDGSTDKTEDIFLTYKPKLEKKGWKVVYIKQPHKNQAAALNKGLKIFRGEYLMWPDSDDILYPNHISKKVELMENNLDCGIGFNVVDTVDESDTNKIIGQLRRIHEENDTLYEDCLFGHSKMLWGGIGNIVRSSAFLDVVPDRDIYEGECGQNFQMIFPIAGKYKACYTEESLAKRVVRKGSHSNLQVWNSPQRIFDHEDTFLHSIMRTQISDNQKTRDIVAMINCFENYKNREKQQIEIKKKVEKEVKRIRQNIEKQQTKNKKITFLGFTLFKIIHKPKTTKIKLFGIIPILKIKEAK